MILYEEGLKKLIRVTLFTTYNYSQSIDNQCSHFIETSHLTYIAFQSTGFCMVGRLFVHSIYTIESVCFLTP